MLLSDIKVGDEIISEFLVSEGKVSTFATLVDDFSPIHCDRDFAIKKGFEGTIAHGLLTSSFISGILGNKLPGPNSVINEINLKYHLPVYLENLIVVRIQVQRVITSVRAVSLDIKINEKKSLAMVLSGRAICSFPQDKAGPL